MSKKKKKLKTRPLPTHSETQKNTIKLPDTLESAAAPPTKYWFRAKRFGWGWVPVTWQGWLVTLLYSGIVAAITINTLNRSPNPVGALFILILPIIFVSAMLVAICFRTGETPTWRWDNPQVHPSIIFGVLSLLFLIPQFIQLSKHKEFVQELGTKFAPSVAIVVLILVLTHYLWKRRTG